MATHGIDDTLNMLHGTSESAKLFGQSNMVSKDQLVAQGQQQTMQTRNDLMQDHMKQLMDPLGNSTMSQKGDAPTQIIKTLPAREVVVIPNIDWDRKDGLDDSWWTRYQAPVPKFEKFSYSDPSMKTLKQISAKDAGERLGTIPDFHVRFDPMFRFRSFLS